MNTKIKQEQIKDFEKVSRIFTYYNLGNMSGEVVLDANNGHIQYGNVTGPLVISNIDNLTDKPILMHIDNSSFYNITLNFPYSYTGRVELDGIFEIYAYEIAGNCFLTIGKKYL